MILPHKMSKGEYWEFRADRHKAENLYRLMLWRMYELVMITRTDIERDLGKYYKYPKCCVDNFTSLLKKGHRVHRYMDFLYGRFPGIRVGYVLCFRCRIMRRR